MYTVTLNQIIQNNVTIFDFDYPIFREEYRETFEQHFIDYFLDEEIAHETVAQFKLRLKSKVKKIAASLIGGDNIYKLRTIIPFLNE